MVNILIYGRSIYGKSIAMMLFSIPDVCPFLTATQHDSTDLIEDGMMKLFTNIATMIDNDGIMMVYDG